MQSIKIYMQATKTFKNSNGDAYEVTCQYIGTSGFESWKVSVEKRPKGKRKFVPIVDEFSYDFRTASDRDAYKYQKYVKEIPKEWILDVMEMVLKEIGKTALEYYEKHIEECMIGRLR